MSRSGVGNWDVGIEGDSAGRWDQLKRRWTGAFNLGPGRDWEGGSVDLTTTWAHPSG